MGVGSCVYFSQRDMWHTPARLHKLAFDSIIYMCVLVSTPVGVGRGAPVCRPVMGMYPWGPQPCLALGYRQRNRPVRRLRAKLSSLPAGSCLDMCVSADLGLVTGAVNIQRAYSFP